MSQTNKILIALIVILLVIIGVFVFSSNKPSEVSEGDAASESASQDGSESNTVKIGFLVPLSGDVATVGEGIKRGVDLAHQRLGADIELITEDSRCDGKTAVSAATKLITVDNVDALIGAACSGASLAAAPLAEEHGVAMVSPASTSPRLSEAGSSFFRTIPSDDLQGRFGAELVYDRGHRTLAILYGNEDYGLGFSTVLSERFAELGGEIVAQETFENQSADLRTQLTKIRQVKPDALYIISNSPDSSAAALKQTRELAIGAELFGSEGLNIQTIVDGAEGAAEGLIVSTVTSGSSEFVALHQATYGSPPGLFAAQAYDAYAVLASVVADGARTRTEIRDALGSTDFDGMSGTIDFDERGDITGNYDVRIVKDNTFVPLESTIPSDEEAPDDALSE